MTDTPNITRRRALWAVGALGVGAWVYAAPRLGAWLPSKLAYRDLEGLAPFRELDTTGTVSGANSMLIGLDGAPTPDAARRVAAARADPCTALFGQTTGTGIPVAFFSDFNCPNCRQLETTLANYQTKHPDVLQIKRFQLPLLGAASVTASKAVLAADLQGGYGVMYERLKRNRMVTDPDLVHSFAEEIGLDGSRLIVDMNRPEIDQALDQAKAIASVFGFYGTPATVIGRTAFMGALSVTDVANIIEAERKLPPLPCQTG
ncbi:DsbA family protein [Pseudorhodobacter aquimaris]|uniref:DsbA family protein n=1 Tax=Pseudorhodobacter aquimaris TaxID=687412 RepID=UPI000ABAA6BD|nr:DsbA family protein [Pseudorhodobacter aquimaris]